ncbi:MAG TPA: HD domain-containing phosphohydrolase [Noviherbaspirillum sp.]|uniref:HD-GYP domain-containing protein n=1 Tax=Noviherbaspirillum sp. TaxID=1926288 RepID=UPI002B465C99|nr:HD domain-containing phosphohydrolase [Noviherbaspirillum sp.]HJV87736.1 HD domain-containing phosphohydrolase [Noviherbaspirillum sp.]
MNLRGLLKNALVRVLAVSFTVAVAAAILGYLHERESAENGSIRMLRIEARRIVPPAILELPSPQREHALAKAIEGMVGGIFSVAEVYAADGGKIAEAVQPGFDDIEEALKKLPHGAPPAHGGYDSAMVLGHQVLRVFTPLATTQGTVIGHLEGVRVLDDIELANIRQSAFISALLAAASVLVCALVLAPLLTDLAVKNFRRAQSLLEAHIGILEALGRAIAKRDSDTGAHNYRVAWIAARLGEEAGLGAAQMRSLIAGSFLHDVGKIGIPDAILLKPGKLDAEEFAIMQQHVELGGQIAGEAGFLVNAREVIEGHHEKWDGSGYPKKLAGEAIPLAARIFCIADVYDALRARRPYKEPFNRDKALHIMREGRGNHFDPALLDRFECLLDEIETRAILAGEEETAALMREMAHRHFFSDAEAA